MRTTLVATTFAIAVSLSAGTSGAAGFDVDAALDECRQSNSKASDIQRCSRKVMHMARVGEAFDNGEDVTINVDANDANDEGGPESAKAAFDAALEDCRGAGKPTVQLECKRKAYGAYQDALAN